MHTIFDNTMPRHVGMPATPDSRAYVYARAFARAMARGDADLAEAWARALRRVASNPARFHLVPADQA